MDLASAHLPTECAAQRSLALVAEASSILQRLDAITRLRVLAALALLLVAGGVLILFARATGRMARWYINRTPRPTRLPGDPFPTVIDGKPRLWDQEQRNWQRVDE